MKITIDAMGGDNAPKAQVLGAMKAVEAFSDVEITLIGNESEINQYLAKHGRIRVIHTDEKILSTDEPVRAVRRKKSASMVLAAQQVADGEADACISSGNTGALMAAGLFVVGRIEGIERPALAPTLPTIDGKGFVLLDVGANSDAKPEHLLQFAIMGSVYAQKVRGIEKHRVGLLNIGTEEKKGNELTKPADVVVTDGFTGNMVLKTLEGTAMGVFKMVKAALMSNLKSKLAAAMVKPELKVIKNKMDYSEYGGAGLFGLKAPVIKAHGSSDANAVYNAIRQTRDMVGNDVISTIAETIEKQ